MCLCRKYPGLELETALALSKAIVGLEPGSATPDAFSFLEEPKNRAITPFDELLSIARAVTAGKVTKSEKPALVSTLVEDSQSDQTSCEELSPVVV